MIPWWELLSNVLIAVPIVKVFPPTLYKIYFRFDHKLKWLHCILRSSLILVPLRMTDTPEIEVCYLGIHNRIYSCALWLE